MFKNRPRNIYVLFCLVVVVLPWFWIPKGFVYTSEEPNFINYDIKLDRASSMWTKDGGFGASADPSNQSLLIPNAIFYKAANLAGLDRSSTQKLFISFTFFSIIVSFGLFSTLLSKNYFIRLLGLSFYIFNFYTVTSVGYTAKILQMILLPLIFYLTVKYLRTQKIKYVLSSYVGMFVFQAIFTNLPTAAVSLSSYFFALLYYLFIYKNDNIKNVFKNFLVIVLPLTPIILHHAVTYVSVIQAMRTSPSFFAFSAIGAPLNLLFQLRGVWWEKSGHMGIYYFSLWKFFDNKLVIFSTVISTIAIIKYSIHVTQSKYLEQRKKMIYWLALYVFGIGLASGYYFLPGFYQWLMEHLPFMIMFREPWAKFVPISVFAFAAIILTLFDYLQRHNPKKFQIASWIIIIYLIIQSYPFLSGKIIDTEVAGWKRRLVKIPDYWEQFSDWTEDNQGVILPLPFGVTAFNSFYNWYGDGIGNTILPMPCIVGKSNVICESAFDAYVSIIKNSINNGNFDFLAQGNIDYVLIQDDLEITEKKESFAWQGEAVMEYLDPDPVAIFGGNLKIYKIKNTFQKPKIYTVSNNVSTPSSEFVQRSQTNYKVTIKKAGDPFILVFNQSFNQNWEISNDKGVVLSTQKHILINEFANGWHIDPQMICDRLPCDAGLSIDFKHQKYFAFSMYLNITIFIISVISIVLISIKKLFKKK